MVKVDLFLIALKGMAIARDGYSRRAMKAKRIPTAQHPITEFHFASPYGTVEIHFRNDIQ